MKGQEATDKTDIQEVWFKHKKKHLQCLNTRRDYSGRFWSLHPCLYSSPRKTACSIWSCSEHRDELDNFQSSLPVSTIPWLWEGLASMQHPCKTWTSGKTLHSTAGQCISHFVSVPFLDKPETYSITWLAGYGITCDITRIGLASRAWTCHSRMQWN